MMRALTLTALLAAAGLPVGAVRAQPAEPPEVAQLRRSWGWMASRRAPSASMARRR